MGTEAPTVKRARRVEVKNEVKKECLVGASVKKEAKKERSGAKDASASTVDVGNQVDATAWEIYDAIRAQAARNIVSTRDIFTMVGIARNVGVDDLLLDVLPKVLSKSPKDRGDFGKLTVNQLDATMKAKRKK